MLINIFININIGFFSAVHLMHFATQKCKNTKFALHTTEYQRFAVLHFAFMFCKTVATLWGK